MNSENKFDQLEKPIELNDIKGVEKKLGFTFPEEIKKHYLKYNGGCPEKYLYRKNDIVLVVNEFLPIKYGPDKGQLEYYYMDLVLEEKKIPQHLVPFAVDPGGDIFCFNTKQEGLGAIYIWQHEECDNSDEGLLYVCSSLRDFINGMEEERE